MDPELVREARDIEDTVEVEQELISRPPRLTIDISAMTVVKVLGVLVAAYVLYLVWPLILLIALAAMLAAAVNPYVAVFERWGLSRPWALTAVSVSIVAFLLGLLVLVVPGLVDQTRSLFAHSDTYVRDLQSLLADHGIHVNLVTWWHSVPKRLSGMSTALVDLAMRVFNGAVALATVVFLTIYLLSDQERIKAFFVGLFPADRRPAMLEVLAELRLQVGGYVRGQLITSALAGVFAFIVLIIAGVPNPITLSVYVAIADLVPMFGNLLGMIPAVLIAVTISPIRGLMVFIGFVLYQNLENHWIVPRVYSQTMRVSSLVALVSLLIGAKLLGMLGLLVALPLVAALPVLLGFAGIHLRTLEPRAHPDPSKDLSDAEPRSAKDQRKDPERELSSSRR